MLNERFVSWDLGSTTQFGLLGDMVEGGGGPVTAIYTGDEVRALLESADAHYAPIFWKTGDSVSMFSKWLSVRGGGRTPL